MARLSLAAVLLFLLVGGTGDRSVTGRAPPAPEPTLVIHGGAGGITRARLQPDQQEAYRAALRSALTAGHAVLRNGGSALDAVEAAIVTMEADPLFNAGRGAVRTREQTIELDAALMEGRTRNAGALTGISTVKHPIRGARAVMAHSEHVMLAGAGAESFAEKQGLERVGPAYFREAPAGTSDGDAVRWDGTAGTVGAVALDTDGNLAAGTSTGGLSGKHVGRVGDSPIIGAGTYAHNASVAVSATGEGEYYMRGVTAHSIAARVRFGGASIPDAARAAVNEAEALGGKGGVIVLGPNGTLAMPFTTAGMFRGHVTSDGTKTVRIFRAEDE